MQENMWARLCESRPGQGMSRTTQPTYFPAYLYIIAHQVQDIANASLSDSFSFCPSIARQQYLFYGGRNDKKVAPLFLFLAPPSRPSHPIPRRSFKVRLNPFQVNNPEDANIFQVDITNVDSKWILEQRLWNSFNVLFNHKPIFWANQC